MEFVDEVARCPDGSCALAEFEAPKVVPRVDGVPLSKSKREISFCFVEKSVSYCVDHDGGVIMVGKSLPP
jgi:hypothetical protein